MNHIPCFLNNRVVMAAFMLAVCIQVKMIKSYFLKSVFFNENEVLLSEFRK